MYKITANGQYVFDIDLKRDQIIVNNDPLTLDVVNLNEHTVHVLYKNRSFNAELSDFDAAAKTCRVKVNGNSYELKIQDQFDALLHQLGMDNLASARISELKAPMPGLVLSVLVKEGDQVAKGDNLLVLEAMKMENIIKAPADVTVKLIKIAAGDKVEKNQVLIAFGDSQ